MLTKFLDNRAGNFAAMFSLCLVPLVLAVGLAVDYSRLVSARSQLQSVADAGALALAASKETNPAKLRQMAENYLAANTAPNIVQSAQIASLNSVGDDIDLSLKGTVSTTFMSLASIDQLNVGVSALAKRAVTGSVEVGLVLDNTWSMSEADASGATKIATLKTAASDLVSQLLGGSGKVKVALVPYADYVNVGTKYRYASWMSVPADYSVAAAPKVCKTLTTKTVCTSKAPTYACTTTIDGVVSPATCGGGCLKSEVQTVPAYQSCTGGGSATNYTWFGCTGSQIGGNDDEQDDDEDSPSARFPGYLDTSQKCPTPIVPLSSDKAAVLAAINGMVINIGSYKPNTYIPAGLIWGQNALAPDVPFPEAANYDPKNLDPRKVVVLMTDGDNTLRLNTADGKHIALSSNSKTAADQVKQVNKDTGDICNSLKKKKVEIYTVAFMVDNDVSRQMLADCATDSDHYYDASDSSKLLLAFQGIADSLTQVRLAR